MSESRETDSLSTDFSQSSEEDSGVQVSYDGSAEIGEHLKGNGENSRASCSDLFAELLQSQKKIKEVETQVRSLSLILDQDDGEGASTGINHAVFQENKHCLQQEMLKMKQDIRDKEMVLQKMDAKLFEQYVESVNDEPNIKTPKLTSSENRQNIISMNSEDTSDDGVETGKKTRDNTNLNESDSSSVSLELAVFPDEFEKMNKSDQDFDKDFEIAKLRRTLNETRQKYKEERDEIMKQLKALQVTTVQGEVNWKCVVKEKQLKIEELTERNDELGKKHAEADLSLKNCERLRQTEAKEANKRKRKNEKIILSLRTQNSRSKEDINQLLSEINELKNFKEGHESLKQLSELNEKLEKDLGDNIEVLDQKNKLIQEYSHEIKETNILVNNLVMEVSSLNTEKANLSKEIEEVKAEKSNIGSQTLDEEQLRIDCEFSVHVGIQTDESWCEVKDDLQKVKAELDSKQAENLHLAEQLVKQESLIERLKKNQIKHENESERWKHKSLQNER